MRRLLSSSRIPNEMAAKSSNNMRGLPTWAVYAVLEDLQRLNWLPVIKRRDLALLKITHKSLYDDVWPDYLRLKFHTVSAYNFEAQKLAIPTESGTFQASTARFFSTLPDSLRQEPDYKKFFRLTKKFMFSEGESV